ncbi:MAG: aldehyde ferredoxin oxidoreductase family protein [Desulfarculus sp.]|nr:aldehyde ferredoxin oxidoreductase family protein [Desulfarculus sp.]
MFGWRDKILRVNLTSGTITSEPLDPALARAYIGGRGLGIAHLLREMDPACDPLSPQNLMVLAVGPLTGTGAPTGARYMVMTKSPLTGAVTCSNSGGQFPAALKKAGWEALIIEGRSPQPVYLWINGGQAELRPASHLWGLDTHRCDDALRAETHAKARTACIGPAGERGVLFASIMNDRDRAAGRSGVGAVMGSKNLKAIAVRGDEPVALHDPAGFKGLVKAILERFQASYPDAPPPLRTYGTAVTVAATQNYGVFPTRNFQQGTFEGWEQISGEALTQKYLRAPKACFACPIACGRATEIKDGPYQGRGEGPEYETVYAMGSDCGISDLAALTKANYLCNELGLDTITMGSTLACAMELSELGLLPQDEVGLGRPLRFGDAAALVELTRLTGLGQGFGQVLGLGSKRLAERYGRPELAMVAKGQEFAGYDPRGEQGMGLAYATSPIGASHMRGDPAYIELLGVPMLIDPHSWQDKPQLVKDWQDSFAVIDAAGLCVFFSVRNLVDKSRAIRPQGIMELLNAATGAGYTLEELCLAGERIFNAERLFLNRAGLDRRHDSLPPRITHEPLPHGPARGRVCHLDEMLAPYYQARGWDQEGRPGPAKLAQLGLGGV